MLPRRSIRIWWLLISVYMLLAACGQKGDLYHPDNKQSRADTAVNSA
ncbi:MAG TPA: lipoprotein [Gammaproteobacteria bacterium]